MPKKSLRQRVMTRLHDLDQEWEYNRTDWEDCADFVDGSRGRFFPSSRDRGAEQRRRRNDMLYNERAKFAKQTLSSGMMAGITSPARPWFALSTGDPQLDENPAVKLWLKATQEIMLQVLGRSNFYQSMIGIYGELGQFGTACMSAFRSQKSVIRFVPYTIGSYRLGVGAERQVDTLYRKYTTSVGSAVKDFGEANVTERIRDLYRKDRDNDRVTIVHAIEPNDDRVYGSPLARDMPWRSVYYEWAPSKRASDERPMRLSGFKGQPFMAPRWSVVEDECYASSYPGIDSIGTNKGLQLEELDYAQAREKSHNPPLLGDAGLQQAGVDQIAGGVTYLANFGTTGKGLQPLYEVRPDVTGLVQAIESKEQRIDRMWYADLFLMLTEVDRAQITATEIAERKEEKLLMLGPVLERLNTELLDPVIDRVFDLLWAQGFIPPPPSVLDGMAGQDLKTEYVSVLAQAQKAVSTAAVEATAAFVANIAGTLDPAARHKFNSFEAIEDYSRAKGVAPDVLRSNDEAQELADAEAQVAQAAQAVEAAPQAAGAMNQAAQAAEHAANTEMNGDPVLDQLMAGLT